MAVALEAELAEVRRELADLCGSLSGLAALHASMKRRLHETMEDPDREEAAHEPPSAPGWQPGESAERAFQRMPTPAPVVCEEWNPMDSCQYSAPPMTQAEFERIAVPLQDVGRDLARVMEEHGCAVVTGVIPSAQELHELEQDFKQDLLDLINPLAMQGAPESVQQAYRRLVDEGPGAVPLNTAKQLTKAAGFVLDRCLNHGRFAWRVRRHPNVHAAFRALFPHEEGKLVTSLDVTFFTPRAQEAALCNQFSAHVDQNRNDARAQLRECGTYQGILYVWPANPDGTTSTTVVWPGSHREAWPKVMDDLSMKDRGERGQHYCEVAGMRQAFVARDLAEGWSRHARRAVLPPGALFLWNSRTMHTGWIGGPRLAQAVCMEPEGRRTQAERLSKLRLAALGLPGCHWASVGMQHDMSLRASGCFSARDLTARAGDGTHDSVVLPLRPALRPCALADGADMEGLKHLVRVGFHLCGMWQAPEDVESLLEASVRQEYKELL